MQIEVNDKQYHISKFLKEYDEYTFERNKERWIEALEKVKEGRKCILYAMDSEGGFDEIEVKKVSS